MITIDTPPNGHFVQSFIDLGVTMGCLKVRYNLVVLPNVHSSYLLTLDSAEILAKELVAVKTGFHQWRRQSEDYSCDSCNKNGCVWCLPKITMVGLLLLMLNIFN
jgi:hypothetical protein